MINIFQVGWNYILPSQAEVDIPWTDLNSFKNRCYPLIWSWKTKFWKFPPCLFQEGEGPKCLGEETNSRWFQIFLYVHPYLGKIPILTNIFQMGWNHQLELNHGPLFFQILVLGQDDREMKVEGDEKRQE